jgi:phosphoribosylformimino-5-aminoimidazole carboxamide ribotide isomerase
MVAIPAIDLRGGAWAGPGGASRIGGPDPISLARDLIRHGFTRVQVVDLDAASRRGSNYRIIRELVHSVDADLQVGGGVCDSDGVRDILDSGARWAVVAARALPDLDLIGELASAFPDEVVLSVAVKGRRMESDGWPRTLQRDVLDLAGELSGIPLAALLLRTLDREGRLDGPDLRLIEDAVEATDLPVMACGGIGTIAHLRSLEDRGASGAVVGTALHAGLMNPIVVASEFVAA